MGRPRGWASAATGRPPMRSPGRPPVARREHRQAFWEAIARGASSEDAGVEAGVSPAVGSRWFREAGGMPTSSFEPHSGRYLSFAEREEIAICRSYGHGVREIAESSCLVHQRCLTKTAGQEADERLLASGIVPDEGTQNSTVVPSPGALSSLHHPPASSARSFPPGDPPRHPGRLAQPTCEGHGAVEAVPGEGTARHFRPTREAPESVERAGGWMTCRDSHSLWAGQGIDSVRLLGKGVHELPYVVHPPLVEDGQMNRHTWSVVLRPRCSNR